MFLKLVRRELLRSWKFGFFFIFNLSLGLTGFISLDAFKGSLEKTLTANARAILSADLDISSRRELTEEEKAILQKSLSGALGQSQDYEFFAMMTAATGSRLVRVHAIDEAYPLYGDLRMASGKVIQGATPEKDLFTSQSLWIYPELSAQMELQPGNEVQLGQLHLKVADVVAKDGTQTFKSAGLAPKVFISRHLLPQSGLMQFGSTFTVDYFFKLASEKVAEAKKKELLKLLRDPAVQIESAKTAGEDSGKQLKYLSDYLGLVAIIALFMSSLGAAYLFRLFLTQRMKEVAILRSLGMQSTQAVALYATQVAVLGLLSLIPTVIVASLLLPALSGLLARLTPFELTPVLSWHAILIALLLGVVGSLVICLPFLSKILDLQPTRLFAEEKFSADVEIRKPWTFLPGILLFWFLAMAQANSLQVGSGFAGAFLLVVLLMSALGFVFLWALPKLPTPRTWVFKQALLGLARRKASSLAIFVALALGSLLINILPQLKVSLQNEFKIDAVSKIPSLFLFDIQDDQVSPLQDFLKSQNLTALELSPLIRARILQVNGQAFERQHEGDGLKTREEEAESRLRNRGVNLSYRENLSETENVTEGKPFTGTFDPSRQKYAELSVEEKYAERLNLHLGDILKFDVQGIEIEGQIVNFRKVKWTSFRPNFFILVQNGVLNEAPKTFITALPRLPEDRKDQLQNQLAKSFPNVSIIDVQRTVNEVLKIADQMSWSLELMAALALFTGYVVLYSIVRSQVRLRRWELNMLKIIGADAGSLSRFLVSEFLILAFVAAFLGSALSLIVSYLISYYVFEGSFVFNLAWPLGSLGGVCLLSAAVAFAASRQVVRESPLVILQEER